MNSKIKHNLNDDLFSQNFFKALKVNQFHLNAKHEYYTIDQCETTNGFGVLRELEHGSTVFDLSLEQKRNPLGHNHPIILKSQNNNLYLDPQDFLRQCNQVLKSNFNSFEIGPISLTQSQNCFPNPFLGPQGLDSNFCSNRSTVIFPHFFNQQITFDIHPLKSTATSTDYQFQYLFLALMKYIYLLPLWGAREHFSLLQTQLKNEIYKINSPVEIAGLKLRVKHSTPMTVDKLFKKGIFIQQEQIQDNTIDYYFPITTTYLQISLIINQLAKD